MVNFGIGQGLTIYDVNGNAYAVYFQDFSQAAPGSGFGIDGDYAVDLTTNDIYKKTSGTWAKTGISQTVSSVVSSLKWVDGVVYITDTDVSAFSGVGAKTLDGKSFTIVSGDTILYTGDNTVYTAGAGTWATGYVMQTNDTFFAQNVTSDPVLQTGSSIFKFNGTGYTRLGDFDFETADSIGFNSYTPPAAGSVTAVSSSDSIESAIEKADTMLSNIRTVLGVLLTATTIGSYNGNTITGTTLTGATGALQNIVDVTRYKTSVVSNVTTQQTVDSVPLASFSAMRWQIYSINTAGTKCDYVTLTTVKNPAGTGIVQAPMERTRQGGNISGYSFTATVAAGNVDLKITSTDAVNVTASRYIMI